MAGSMAGRPRGSSRVTEPRARRRVQVVVLGDFGRSPRMQFHALSLADQAHFEVDVVAYTGSTPRGEILAHPHIHLRLIPPPPAWLKRLPTALGLAVRVLLQLVQLTVLMLVRLKRPHFVLLQTPPCVPAFAVCRLVAFLRNATFIIDWHNMAYTLMGLSLGHGHFLVQAARGYEKLAGRRADKHMCVTNAMSEWLEKEWGIQNVSVVHDKPPAFFKPICAKEAHDLFLRLENTLDNSGAKAKDDLSLRDAFCFGDEDEFDDVDFDDFPNHESPDAARAAVTNTKTTPITTCLRASETTTGDTEMYRDQNKGKGNALEPRWRDRADRPCVLVSSTSWTADEDFGVLLDALVLYDVLATQQLILDVSSSGGAKKSLPNLLVIVTGKGPQRAMYETRMRGLNLKRVVARTAWITSEDYPKVLAASDLGVCLHTSSSGLDLPMKIVDMFGCGVPVLAARYGAIGELVVSREAPKSQHQKRNGALFSSATELAESLCDLLQGWGARDNTELDVLRRGAAQSANTRWAEHWEKYAAPLFRE